MGTLESYIGHGLSSESREGWDCEEGSQRHGEGLIYAVHLTSSLTYLAKVHPKPVSRSLCLAAKARLIYIREEAIKQEPSIHRMHWAQPSCNYLHCKPIAVPEDTLVNILCLVSSEKQPALRLQPTLAGLEGAGDAGRAFQWSVVAGGPTLCTGGQHRAVSTEPSAPCARRSCRVCGYRRRWGWYSGGGRRRA